jgi:outer membrane protein insertion porin family
MKYSINKNLLEIVLITVLMYLNTFAQSIIGSIQFEGNSKFSDEQLLDWSELKTGNFFDKNMVVSINKKIIENFYEQGYLYAQIDSVSIRLNKKKQTKDIIWYIKENLPFYIGSITIVSDSIPAKDIVSQMDLREGDIYNQKLIEQEIKIINKLYANKGFPFVKLIIENVNIIKNENSYNVDLTFNINSGNTAEISNIMITGNKVTKDEVILREIEIKPGDKYRQDEVEQIPYTLNKLGFFKQVDVPILTITKEKDFALIINVEDGNSTTFDGIVGYIPDDPSSKKNEGYFTGLLNASFRNLFGTGRKFEIFWEKPDKYSDQFKLYYEEPWIFNIPLNLGAGLERLVRDTTYIERSYFLNSSFRISNELKSIFSFYQKVTIPDSAASRDLRLARNIINTFELGIEYDTRDYPINPRSGIYYSAKFSFGQKQNTGPSYLIKEDNITENEELQKIQNDFTIFQPVLSNQILYFHIYGSQIKSNENQLQLTDHTWFGGAKSLRGYRENQFHGSVVSWLNLEYRFLIGRNSRIFIFNDWGFYFYKDTDGKKENVLPGYGLGIRFDTALGVMGVDFGLGKNDSFSNGKIHFGIENSF